MILIDRIKRNIQILKLRKFYRQNKDKIRTSIMTLPYKLLIYRDSFTIDNGPKMPLARFYLNKTKDTDEVYQINQDIKCFKCEIDSDTSLHYVVPTLLKSTLKNDILNKDLIYRSLMYIDCKGTVEKRNNNFEICIPIKYCNKVI